MPSPFPGMDPWLESTRYFGDLHDSFIYGLQQAIQPQLPEFYVARKTIRVILEAPERRAGPDVYIARTGAVEATDEFPAAATIGETGPHVVTADMPELEEIEERYLDIYKIEGKELRLVTSIEVLSPTNKGIVGSGREEYLRKQRDVIKSRVNLIEIDLLRGGRHTTAVPEEKIKEFDRFDYHVSLWYAGQPDRYFVYPFDLTDPLPEIAIPLEQGDPTLTVALQPIMSAGYEVGAFDRQIDYANDDPDPPLTDDQKEWADAILRAVK